MDLIQWRARIGSHHSCRTPAPLNNSIPSLHSWKRMQSISSGATLALVGGGALLFAIQSFVFIALLFVVIPKQLSEYGIHQG